MYVYATLSNPTCFCDAWHAPPGSIIRMSWLKWLSCGVLSGCQMGADSLHLRCGVLSGSKITGVSLRLRRCQEVRLDADHCLAKHQRVNTLWSTPNINTCHEVSSVALVLHDSIKVRTIWESTESTMLGSSVHAACFKEIWLITSRQPFRELATLKFHQGEFPLRTRVFGLFVSVQLC